MGLLQEIIPLRGPTCKYRTCKNPRQVGFQVGPSVAIDKNNCGNKRNFIVKKSFSCSPTDDSVVSLTFGTGDSHEITV